MSRKAEYRAFLRTDFWKTLSQEKKDLVGECERCGSDNNLQSHHVKYPKNWFETTLDDLEVLCRKCHQTEHGISPHPFIIFRNDVKWSRRIWRVDMLHRLVWEGYALTDRDRKFLKLVSEAYPKTPSDGCMAFHVENCLNAASLATA